MKQLIEILQTTINDISKNYKDFNQTKLVGAISKFQNNILNLRKVDIKVRSELENLTSKQILDSCNKLKIYLLSPPKQKSKLIALITRLILQNKKKDELLELIKSVKKPVRIKSLKKPQKLSVPSTSEYKDLKKLWLTSKNLTILEQELQNTNMNVIRSVVKPWSIKPDGRTKNALITAVINYIKRMRRLSKLGT